MGKILIVAEKPSVARDIALALGGFHRNGDFLESDTAVVSSAVGHLVEIFAPEAETSGRDLASLPVIPVEFSLRSIPKTEDQFNLLRRLMSRPDVDRIANACDAGREGELIFRLIYEHAKCSLPTMRMWLQSMTADAIRDAFRTMKPGTAFDDLASAAKCRSESDWLVGINGSRGISRLNERKSSRAEVMSVGRVQTPTLAILVHQEAKIRNFVPQDYWEVFGTFCVASGSYTAKWLNPSVKPDVEGSESVSDRFFDKAQAEAIVSKIAGQNPASVKDESKAVTKQPPKLFDLTSLQKEANKRYKLSAKQTLDIAQALYEKYKATTYPRTDAKALPEDYIPKTKDVMSSFSGTPYEVHSSRVLANSWIRPDKRIFDNSKISDHFAIIPTGQRPEGLTPIESKVYDLIVLRFIAAFHPAAEFNQTTRTTIVAGEHFKCSGKVLTQPGWLVVTGQEKDDEDKTPALCGYTPGEVATTTKIETKSSRTKPPPRYTEATLLSAMEHAGKLIEDDDDLRDAMKERGLGTPATRASIIEVLLNDKDANNKPKEPYARRSDNGTLVPSPKGIGLIDFLESNGIELLASPRLTGEWENKLLLMEKGAYSRPQFMSEIADMTRGIIEVIRTQAKNVALPAASVVAAPCPRCGGQVGAVGLFYECQTGCGFKLWKEIAGRVLKTAEVSDLIEHGTVGPLDGFISKTKKKFSASLNLGEDFRVSFSLEERPTADPDGNPVTCYICASPMSRIMGKKGAFWSCSDRDHCSASMDDDNGYPKARHLTPDGKSVSCSVCGALMIRRKGSLGHFWCCSSGAKCDSILEDKDGFPISNTLTPDGKAVACPNCSKPMRRIKTNSGHFWGCSDRDNCKGSMADHEGYPVARNLDANGNAVKCPKCGSAMTKIKGPRGFFWGCSAYKTGCKSAMDDKDGMPVARKSTEGAFL